jgi:putative tryptophan/tyrosine transport system substrate-binding protein
MIGRREFIAGLGGAAAWPLPARAQQPTMPVIGLLHPGSPEANARYVAGFRKGLAETSYVEGRNVSIEYRWGHGESRGCRSWRPTWSGGRRASS